MAPSDMELRIGTIECYNNKIILSTHDQKLWWNATVNRPAKATSYSGDVSGTPTHKSTAHTRPTGPQNPLNRKSLRLYRVQNNRGTWDANNDTHSKTGGKNMKKKNRTISQNQRHLWFNNHTRPTSDVTYTPKSHT